MLRLITNKAKHHYNLAIDHAERNRYYQAISELQNCLDLDKNNISAHVLLGTIYAKQNKFDSALQEWEAALSLHPSLFKSHQYIERAEQVKSALPVLKWVKVLLAGLFISFACIIVLSLHIVQPHPSEDLLEKAISDYRNKRFGDAVRKVESFSSKYGSSPLLPIAQLVNESIREKMDAQKQKIRNRLQAKDFSGAMDLCKQLEAYHPDPETGQFLKHIKTDARLSMKESIEKSLAENFKTLDDMTPLEKQIETLRIHFPEEPSLEAYHSRMAAIESRVLKKDEIDLQNKLDEILAIRNPQTVLSELIRFNRLNPEFASKAFVPRSIREIKKNIYYDQFRIVQDSINQNDFTSAEASLATLSPKDLSEFPLLLKEYEHYESLLSREKSEQEQKKIRDYLESLEKSLASGNAHEALSLISQKDSYQLAESERLYVESIQGKIQIRQAMHILQHIIHEKSFHSLEDLSREDAEEILSDLSRLKKDLPDDSYNQYKDHLLFLSCASYAKLGEKAQAQKMFQNLLQEFPYSPFLSPAVKILESSNNIP
ncbi:tetratricopeptide repeat protein [Candidatus Sumerlaeota bacterium]|nr:tetratricopeptide repeat protein [Candidatus Sumerlaeota bacterium]